MSRTEMLYIDKAGDVHPYKDFWNSHRGAPVIWDNMVKTHIFNNRLLHTHSLIYATFPDSGLGKYQYLLWYMAYDRNIPIEDRIVLMGTFSHVILKRENIPRYLLALKLYMRKYRCGNHDEQYTALKYFYKRKKYRDAVGICWNQTSVSCGDWNAPYGEEQPDEPQPHNIFKHKHYSRESGGYTQENIFLFDELGEEFDSGEAEKYKAGMEKVSKWADKFGLHSENQYERARDEL